MREEGTVAAVAVFPSPWPPPVPVELLAREQDGTRVVLSADTRGCLLVSFHRGAKQQTHEFGPLPIPAAARVVLVLSWSPAQVSLALNGVELEGREVGAQQPQLPSRGAGIPPMGLLFPHLKSGAGVSEAEQLFVSTVIDIDRKAVAGDHYSLIRASGLLRQLLLDDTPLVQTVNRIHRLRLQFRTIDFTLPPPIEPEAHWMVLDPSPFPGARTIACTCLQFLAAPCLKWKHKVARVKDLIRACANAKGGVHLGKAKTADEQLVLDWDEVVTVLGEQPSLRAIAGVCRVALRGLGTLVDAIERGAA
jgi:hypothetical protein